MPKMAVNQENFDKQDFALCTTKLITFGQTWTIEDMHSACADTITGFPIMMSVPFMAPPDQFTNSYEKPIWFQLHFYPKGKSAESADFIGIFLQMCHTVYKCNELLGKFSISFVDAKGDKQQRYHMRQLFKAGTVSGSSEMIRRAELLDPTNGFLQDGKLLLNCEVGIFKCNEASKSIGLSSLSEQLADKLFDQTVPVDKWIANLLDSGAHADVTLVLVDDGGQELCAHKLILATRSQVFGDMFECCMSDCSTNRVEIVETRVEVFKQVLNCIYTGKVTSLDGIAFDLLICADKYQLDPLKSICEDYLGASITAETDLIELLELANRCNAPKLQAKVLDLLRNSNDFDGQILNLVQMKRQLSTGMSTDKKSEI